jgi:hypothetical protein
MAVVYHQTFLLLATLTKTIRWLWYVPSNLLPTSRIKTATGPAMGVKAVCLLLILIEGF